jgi:uncharacterized phage-associated protein
MQLQKLVYISHGWALALLGTPLTTEQPRAWDYGPVYADLYDHTKYFGKRGIDREVTPDDDEAARFFRGQRGTTPAYRAALTPNERSVIASVRQRYGRLSGAQLSAMTHQPGTPWSIIYDGGRGKNREIPNELITAHYREIAQRARAAG